MTARYKVVTSFWNNVEELLNELAQEGWRPLHVVSTSSHPEQTWVIFIRDDSH